MSQASPPDSREPDGEPTTAEQELLAGEGAPTAPASSPVAEEPTVGTGSAVAIGCVIVTVLILALGILVLLWLR